MGGKGRIVAVILIQLLIITVFSGITPYGVSYGSEQDGENTASDTALPDLWITMDKETYGIKPIPRSTYLLQGKLHCEFPASAPYGMIKVYLGASTEYSNGSVLLNAEFLFGPDGGVLSFNVSVNPAPFDIAGLRYDVLVSGTWNYRNIKVGGDVEPDTFAIVNEPISNPVLEPLSAINDLTLKDSDWHEIRFILENKGNCDDRITLTAKDIPESLTVRPVKEVYEVPLNNHMTVTIEVKKTDQEVDSGFLIDVEPTHETPGRDPDIVVTVKGEEPMAHEEENEIITYALVSIPLIIIGIIIALMIFRLRAHLKRARAPK